MREGEREGYRQSSKTEKKLLEENLIRTDFKAEL